MQYGFVLPGGTATEQLTLAVVTEEAGWDGVFVWEAAYGVDAWTLLAAMAQRTTRVRLGTLLTPLPWRRPWKVASQAVTLDQVSGGRAILAVGLGAVETGLGQTGEEIDRRVRAEMLDEGIDLITSLWAGRLRFKGRHYQVDLAGREDLARVARPVQHPRIPTTQIGMRGCCTGRNPCAVCCAVTVCCPCAWTRAGSGPLRPTIFVPCGAGSTRMVVCGRASMS